MDKKCFRLENIAIDQKITDHFCWKNQSVSTLNKFTGSFSNSGSLTLTPARCVPVFVLCHTSQLNFILAVHLETMVPRSYTSQRNWQFLRCSCFLQAIIVTGNIVKTFLKFLDVLWLKPKILVNRHLDTTSDSLFYNSGRRRFVASDGVDPTKNGLHSVLEV